MAFDGNLVYLVGSSDATPFPIKYVYKDSYVVAPNRRQDLDSAVNANGVLERNVLDVTRSTIKFTVKPMYNHDLAEFMRIVRNKYSSQKEKKIQLYYYCPDLDDYKVGNFYVPDIEFPIMQVDSENKRIRYGTFDFEFIEYGD